VDFSRQTSTLVARISQVEYDPNRSAQIALLHYSDGSKKYVISPRGLEVGQQVCAGETAPVQIGNAMPLRSLPVGCFVHNVELVRGRGGQLARASGTSAKISGTDGNYVILKLPSKEKRLVHKECFASVGHVGTPASNKKTLGKAGRKRWLGRRPTVRGVAKNPVDHPHGGGEGRSPIGLTQPVSPWGKPALGTKTRKAAKSNRFIYRD
jgi:large subunit ribosomal protein L2